MLTKGATTIWELWNGDTAAPSMNSGNHVMLLGDLLIWCFENLAGISSDTEQVAYKRIVMKPDFGIADLNFINASYKTPYGLVVSNWKKSEGSLDWSIKVPANSSALVYLPVVRKKNIKESDRPIGSSRTIRYLGTENNGTLIELGSGEYHFNVQL
jgi:alpha-L-rhamnosidase